MIGFVTSLPPMLTVTTSTLSRGLSLPLRSSSSGRAVGSWFAIIDGVVAPPTAMFISSSWLQPCSGFALSDGEQSNRSWRTWCSCGT